MIASPAEVRAQFRRVKPLPDISVTQRGWTLDVLNIVLGSATVPVAVCNVPLRTFSTLNVRRDADRRARGACAPHFTRELEKLHPDISKAEVKTKTKLTPTATSATTP